MASKRKRRRLAAAKKARAAAKLAEQQRKERHMDYKVAVQKAPGDPMRVFTVREENPAELLPFIARVVGVTDVKELAHLDVHLPLADGSVRVVYESSPEWPNGVKVKHEPGLVVRGKASSHAQPEKQSPPKEIGVVFAKIPTKKYKLVTLIA